MRDGTWTIEPCDWSAARRLAEELEVQEVTASILVRRGHTDAAEARLEQALRDARVQARATVVPLPVPLALAQVAEERRAGLVVVGSLASGKLGSLLRGSVVTQLRAQVDCPLVVLPRTAQIVAGSGHYEVSAGAA